jgi:uncharacterized paraquat-inducible protein A
MALIACAACRAQISADALACPRCGKPNTPAVNKHTDARQRTGCALMIASVLIGFFFNTLIGVLVFLVGLVYAAANTRLK